MRDARTAGKLAHVCGVTRLNPGMRACAASSVSVTRASRSAVISTGPSSLGRGNRAGPYGDWILTCAHQGPEQQETAIERHVLKVGGSSQFEQLLWGADLERRNHADGLCHHRVVDHIVDPQRFLTWTQ
jgi:hypothetical protein